MKIYSVYDPAFKSYGQIVEGMEDAIAQIMDVLKNIPLPHGVDYMPEDPALQSLSAMQEIADRLFGGMPVQLGWCCGHNTKLNCLEYHRDSEFNLGAEDFILLLARQDEIADGALDTAKVKAFWVPAGVMVECFATTLHYAPCHAASDKGFRVLVALPKGTNTAKPDFSPKSWEDRLLYARNKWLLAHPDSSEAADGAYLGITGKNIDIADLI